MMDLAVFLTPWMLVFVYMALWLQASRHKRHAWKSCDEAWRHANDAQCRTEEALTVNDHLLAVIRQYEEMHANHVPRIEAAVNQLVGSHGNQSVSEASRVGTERSAQEEISNPCDCLYGPNQGVVPCECVYARRRGEEER